MTHQRLLVIARRYRFLSVRTTKHSTESVPTNPTEHIATEGNCPCVIPYQPAYTGQGIAGRKIDSTTTKICFGFSRRSTSGSMDICVLLSQDYLIGMCPRVPNPRPNSRCSRQILRRPYPKLSPLEAPEYRARAGGPGSFSRFIWEHSTSMIPSRYLTSEDVLRVPHGRFLSVGPFGHAQRSQAHLRIRPPALHHLLRLSADWWVR